jgi:hypothetical protein
LLVSAPFDLSSSLMRSAKKTFSNHWYGTSLLFASIFKSSSIDSGSLMEIVLVDGFKLGNDNGFAFPQSRYSVESWFDQNSPS